MTTTTATTPNIADLLAKLKAKQPSLADLAHCRSDAERADFWARYNGVGRLVSGLMNLPADVRAAQAKLDDATARRAAVAAKQAELEAAIASAPDLTSIKDARERDREHERQRDFGEALARLDDGTLMATPSTSYERLPDLDARIAELSTRRDVLQRALDGQLEQASTLTC